jgi:HPt (histidine-containing phosphotransfer) domain-containing protein
VRDETREKNIETREEPPEEQRVEIKIEGIETANGLELFDGNTGLYIFALQSYVKNLPATLDKLRTVSENSLSDYAINVHGVKGTSANIGAEKLREMAAKLETTAKAGDLQGLLVENKPFLEYADKLVEAVKNWLKEHTGGD